MAITLRSFYDPSDESADVFGLFQSNKEKKDAKENLQSAVDAYTSVGIPLPDELKYQIQQYTQAGIITPEEADTISQGQTAFSDISVDSTGRDAEIAALKKLQEISDAGGNDAQYQEAIGNATDTINTQLRGQREAIMQDAAQRGTANAGTTLAAKLSGISDATRGANQAGVSAAADAEKRALEALSQSATIGGTVTAQDYAEEAAKASAIDAINKYNAQNAQSVESSNVAAKNAAQAANVAAAQSVSDKNVSEANTKAKYDATIPQQIYEDELAKAEGISNAYTNTAKNDAANSANSKSGLGGVIGAIGALFSKGGEVPGKAKKPGDSIENDTVPAMLSPGEVVLPKSVTESDNAPELAKEFVKNLPEQKDSSVHPHDIKAVFRALASIRGECGGGKAGYAFGGEIESEEMEEDKDLIEINKNPNKTWKEKLKDSLDAFSKAKYQAPEFTSPSIRRFALGGEVGEEEPIDPIIPTTSGNPILTPENRAMLYDELQKKKSGGRSKLAIALSGLGDAISASGGNKTNFLGQTLDRQAQTDKDIMANFDKKRALSIEDAKLKEAADRKDPLSQISKTKREAYKPVFLSAGYKDADLEKISAEDVDSVVKYATSMQEAKVKAAALRAEKENAKPKPPSGYRYTSNGDLELVPGGPEDKKDKEAKDAKLNSFKLYETARDGLLSGLGNSATGPFVGLSPAITAKQQIASGSVAAMAPVLKQLFRVAGEGTFTDKDQALLLDMVPTRKDTPEAIKVKTENIDRIVKAKLGIQSNDQEQASPASTAPYSDSEKEKRYQEWKARRAQ